MVIKLTRKIKYLIYLNSVYADKKTSGLDIIGYRNQLPRQARKGNYLFENQHTR
jgi:hypothetical protein